MTPDAPDVAEVVGWCDLFDEEIKMPADNWACACRNVRVRGNTAYDHRGEPFIINDWPPPPAIRAARVRRSAIAERLRARGGT